MNPNTKKILVWSSAIVLLGVGGYVGYRVWKKAKDKREEEKKRLEELAAQAAQQNQGGGGGGYQGGGGGGTVTPLIPAEVDTPEELKAFQKWVINTKGDKTILGKGGDSGFGDDGKWGNKSKAAWAKYGEEYKKTLNPDTKPDDKPVQISADLQKDIDVITQFGKGEKAKSAYLKSGIDKQSKKDWIKSWAKAIRERTNDSTKGTTFVWMTGGQDWGLYEAYSGEKILKYNPKGKNPAPLAKAYYYEKPEVSNFSYVGATGDKIGTIGGYTYNNKTKKLWLYIPIPLDSYVSDAYLFGTKWMLAEEVKFA
jgi:type II secretory pathway pseudopilin PulG